MTLPTFDRATLAGWDAVETASRIRSKEITADEVVEAAIERAEKAHDLGGVVEPCYSRARVNGASSDCAPWLGVPTFVKDMARVAGVPTTWGSLGSGRYVSKKSDPFVRSFEHLGVVILGKSATSELALMPATESLARPPCRNPWDVSRSSGGSSGGAACLVAAGVVPVAHGVDGGGSIRIPAACCGLVGFKPSRFRLDAMGSSTLPVNIATDGILSRSVRDTVAFYVGLESRRPPRRVPAIASSESQLRRPLRMAVFVDAPARTPVNAEVRDAVLAAARLCETLGHTVDPIPCPFDGSVTDDFLRYWGFLAWAQVRTARLMLHWHFDRSKLEPWSRGLAATFARAKVQTIAAIWRLRRFSRAFATVTNRYDVLVFPTLAEPAPPLGTLAADRPFATTFERVRSYAAAFTPLANVSGAPAITLPMGRTVTGLPVGVQFAAAHGHDRVLLDLALALEATQPWEAIAPQDRWLAASAPPRAPTGAQKGVEAGDEERAARGEGT
jgi:amidase